jgi:hypothetical protein
MSANGTSSPRSNAMFGLASLVTALCCVAAPAALGAAVGAAVGNALVVAAAVVVALAAVLAIRRLRSVDRDG